MKKLTLMNNKFVKDSKKILFFEFVIIVKKSALKFLTLVKNILQFLALVKNIFEFLKFVKIPDNKKKYLRIPDNLWHLLTISGFSMEDISMFVDIMINATLLVLYTLCYSLSYQ